MAIHDVRTRDEELRRMGEETGRISKEIKMKKEHVIHVRLDYIERNSDLARRLAEDLKQKKKCKRGADIGELEQKNVKMSG